MIKRLIFDLDNTIIMWRSEYVNVLKDLVYEYKLDVDYRLIDNIIEKLEHNHDILSKEALLNDINNELNLGISIDFVDELIERQKESSPENIKEMIDLFEYLSRKYEIVLLSNYFRETQIGRLKKLGIYKYFDNVYGGEDHYLKPNKQAFELACGDNKFDDCLMIGDSDYFDIIPANELSINVIKVGVSDKFNCVDNILMLKEIL